MPTVNRDMDPETFFHLAGSPKKVRNKRLNGAELKRRTFARMMRCAGPSLEGFDLDDFARPQIPVGGRIWTGQAHSSDRIGGDNILQTPIPSDRQLIEASVRDSRIAPASSFGGEPRISSG